MTLFRVEDGQQPYEWEGELISDPPVSTYRPGRPRWFEMRCYRLDNDAGYVLHRSGHSIVYHVLDGPCRDRGSKVRVSELPEGAVACQNARTAKGPVCTAPLPWPSDELDGVEYVILERVRHTIDHGPTAEAIVEQASVANHRKTKTVSHGYSQPVAELIGRCAKNDPEWEALESRPRDPVRIG